LAYNPEIIAVFSKYLINQHKFSEAENLLRRTLGKKFNDNLIDLYGQIKNNNARLSFAESLLKEHPHSSALLLCLGRLSVDKNLWGKACTYFESSVKYNPKPEAYFELGQLLQQQLNEKDKACAAFRKGLILATGS
jgi:HemY protein